MTIDELFAEGEQELPRPRRTITRILATLAALVVGVGGVVWLIVLLLGSFQGTYLTISGEVSTCGYASISSTCQDDLREKARGIFHFALGDDVRVEQIRKYGFPDPVYDVILIFSNADAATSQGFSVHEIRPGGAAVVKFTRVR